MCQVGCSDADADRTCIGVVAAQARSILSRALRRVWLTVSCVEPRPPRCDVRSPTRSHDHGHGSADGLAVAAPTLALIYI